MKLSRFFVARQLLYAIEQGWSHVKVDEAVNHAIVVMWNRTVYKTYYSGETKLYVVENLFIAQCYGILWVGGCYLKVLNTPVHKTARTGAAEL